MKQPASLLLGPVPTALITCGNSVEQNIITLAWVGVVNSSPPMISASVRPNRHSCHLIQETGEFTVNIPYSDQVSLVDGCGTLSGKDLNKFEHFRLTPILGTLQYAPLIDECPISMECKVEHTLRLGSHFVFIGRVVASYISTDITDEKGKIDFNRCRLLGFCDGRYLETAPLNHPIGFTIKK
ncbi:MAG TPA: flavin reductase family protein [Candidatus Limnocylindrales bacterium]|nr:flavin reductase family protein [Candidatus Limnocylindrales bacterium]